MRVELRQLPCWCEALRLDFEQFDRAYMDRLLAGDVPTQRHFFDYFSRLIRIKMGSRRVSPEAADDILQETFRRVFASLASEAGIRQPNRLGPYVNSVCNNVLHEHFRGSARTQGFEDEEEGSIPDPKADALGTVLVRETQSVVMETLQSLPVRDRAILVAVFIEERDKDEVCREFGVTRDFLRVLTYRARKKFKLLYLNNLQPPSS